MHSWPHGTGSAVPLEQISLRRLPPVPYGLCSLLPPRQQSQPLEWPHCRPHILSQDPSTTGPMLFRTPSGHLSLLICRIFFLFHDRMHSLINMATPVSSTNGRRTNSLGSAKPDCHTCSALHRKCGRQRPRCRTCQDTGVVCKGFSMQLSWHRGLSVQNAIESGIWRESGFDSSEP
jgi:hypothetical protein